MADLEVGGLQRTSSISREEPALLSAAGHTFRKEGSE